MLQQSNKKNREIAKSNSLIKFVTYFCSCVGLVAFGHRQELMFDYVFEFSVLKKQTKGNSHLNLRNKQDQKLQIDEL